MVNAFTGQESSVVSDVKGTTTDPVIKAMELLPMGPVEIIDTPGIDDEGALGELRVKKTLQILNRADLRTARGGCHPGAVGTRRQLLELFHQKRIPHLIVYNKCDQLPAVPADTPRPSESAPPPA